jgi:hypothetical protein
MELINFAQLPILEDFEIFLTFLNKPEPIGLTTGKGQLKKDDLYRLNGEMHHQTAWVTDKSVQYAYPLLDFFFQVIIKSKLARIYHLDKGIILKPDLEKLAKYRSLTPEEQYFFLVETFWRYLNWAAIMEMRSNLFIHFLKPGLEILSLMEEEKEYEIVNDSLPGLPETNNLNFRTGRKIYEILGFLEFYELEPKVNLPKKPDKYTFPYAAIKAKKLGLALLPVLLEQRPLDTWNLPFLREIEADESDFPLFLDDFLSPDKNLLSEAAKSTAENLPIPVTESDPTSFLAPFQSIPGLTTLLESFYTYPPAFKPGTYTLKIALAANIYRTVAVAANHTLYQLHEVIQQAFKFDDDHLYAFFMDGEPWSTEAFYSPEAEHGPTVDEVKLGDLDLAAGQGFLYIFDFGDEWGFWITVLQIEETLPEPKQPKILEQAGKAPKQYGNNNW